MMIVTQQQENISQHLRGICRASLWSAIARGTKKIYVTNQLMDNFYVLPGTLIEKRSFQVS